MDRRGGFVHAVDREDVGDGGFDVAGDGYTGAHCVGTLPDLVRFIGKGIAVDHGFTLPWTAVEVGGNRALGTAATTVGAVTDRGIGEFQVKDGATIGGKRVGAGWPRTSFWDMAEWCRSLSAACLLRVLGLACSWNRPNCSLNS